ncbi:hypothetical protein DM80_2218 [Burkholderia multivorans]|nr:hypothetical protein DM80_2218 [Burkholderia multivorans]
MSHSLKAPVRLAATAGSRPARHNCAILATIRSTIPQPAAGHVGRIVALVAESEAA